MPSMPLQTTVVPHPDPGGLRFFVDELVLPCAAAELAALSKSSKGQLLVPKWLASRVGVGVTASHVLGSLQCGSTAEDKAQERFPEVINLRLPASCSPEHNMDVQVAVRGKILKVSAEFLTLVQTPPFLTPFRWCPVLGRRRSGVRVESAHHRWRAR
jgi:hypothetical protein